MGIDAFAERARRELQATGAKARKRAGREARDELTPQEEQIARLARDGLTNPEIGARALPQPAHRRVAPRRCSPSSGSARAWGSTTRCRPRRRRARLDPGIRPGDARARGRGPAQARPHEQRLRRHRPRRRLARRALRRGAGRRRAAGRRRRARAGRRRVLLLRVHPVEDAAAARRGGARARATRRRPRRSTSRRRWPGATSWSPNYSDAGQERWLAERGDRPAARQRPARRDRRGRGRRRAPHRRARRRRLRRRSGHPADPGPARARRACGPTAR